MDATNPFRQALIDLCERTPGGVDVVADMAGLSSESLSQVMNGIRLPSGNLRGLGPTSRRKLEAAFPGWMSLNKGLPMPPTEGVAQVLSYLPATVVPTIEWGGLMTEQLPEAFKVELPDNSMSPRAPAGAQVEFRRGSDALAGDGVLVRDRSGAFYFREYRIVRAGVWEAHADNSAYKPLESIRDGLEVIGVLTAVHSRWGR